MEQSSENEHSDYSNKEKERNKRRNNPGKEEIENYFESDENISSESENLKIKKKKKDYQDEFEQDEEDVFKENEYQKKIRSELDARYKERLDINSNDQIFLDEQLLSFKKTKNPEFLESDKHQLILFLDEWKKRWLPDDIKDQNIERLKFLFKPMRDDQIVSLNLYRNRYLIYVNRLTMLKLLFRRANLINDDNLNCKYSQIFNDLFSVIFYAAESFQAQFKILMIWGNDRKEISFFNCYPWSKFSPISTNLKPLPKVILYILSCAEKYQYRRLNGFVYRELITKEGYRTNTYLSIKNSDKSILTIEQFVKSCCSETNSEAFQELLSSVGNLSAVVKFLNVATNHPQFPLVLSDRYYFSFRNGIYNCKADSFFPYKNLNRMSVIKNLHPEISLEDEIEQENEDFQDLKNFEKDNINENEKDETKIIYKEDVENWEIGDVYDWFLNLNLSKNYDQILSKKNQLNGALLLRLEPESFCKKGIEDKGDIEKITKARMKFRNNKILNRDNNNNNNNNNNNSKIDPRNLFIKSCCNYFDQDFCFEKYEKYKDPMQIPTPQIQSILDQQNFTKKKIIKERISELNNNEIVEKIVEREIIDDSISRWFYIFAGRLLFNLNEFDRWQVAPFLLGRGGTGKSTIIQFLESIYPPDKVGILANYVEKHFPLMGIYNKWIVLAPEIKRDFNLEQTAFQSLISGDTQSVAMKHKEPISYKLICPPYFAGNEFPGFEDKSGSISRRTVVFFFENLPEKSNPNLLQSILKEEIVDFIVKATKLYLEAAKSYGNSDIWTVLPQYFHDNKEKLKSMTNSLRGFFLSDYVTLYSSSKIMSREEGESSEDYSQRKKEMKERMYETVEDFSLYYTHFCKSRGMRNISITEENYKTIFSDLGIEFKKSVSIPISKFTTNDLKKTADVIYGIELNRSINITNNR